MLIRGVVLATTLLLGCGPSGGTVSLVLDIPNAALDPKGFSTVEVHLHHPDGDTALTVWSMLLYLRAAWPFMKEDHPVR